MNNQNSTGQYRLFRKTNWSKERFFKNQSLHKTSRYLITTSINYLLEHKQRILCKQNNEIYESIQEIDQHLDVLTDKFYTLNDICLFLRMSPANYFEERMTRLRHSTKQYMAAIEQEIHEEVEHWQDIHSILSQPLLKPGLLRSYYGGLPQPVQQSPSSELNTIQEENETRETTSIKSNRILAPISKFSILSNGFIQQQNLLPNKLNKSFAKYQSLVDDSLTGDENFTPTKLHKTFIADSENDTTDDTVIYID
ncbi:unnamed protein product [Adineta steineri]|uniref:Uncharacterized protein n=2 Tax=Adineta steineri TaxID=433720 RepID=A0A818UCU1_9BILA|nr:unnamed protein product [Adineta steineri]